jgi:hypothetical protein
MSQGKPAEKMDRRRRSVDRAISEGDLMVTAVGEHFSIGRLKADRETQEFLGSQRDRAAALQQACALAGANHRVFLCAKASHTTYLPFDCAARVSTQRGMPMTPLTDDDKGAIVWLFTNLQSAIERGATDTPAKYRGFQSAYRGDSRAFVDGFDRLHTAVEQKRWASQLRNYLAEEIEPPFWSPRN